MDLTNEELNALYDAISDVLFDKVHHYPDECDEDEKAAIAGAWEKVRAECAARKFWWTK